MNMVLVICDREEGYAEAFASYLTRRRELPFLVQVCTDRRRLLEMQEKEDIRVLIMGDGFPPEERRGLKADMIWVLTEDGDPELLPEERALYRLQPGDRLLAQILEAWTGQQDTGPGMLWKAGRQSVQVTGIFSPVHRSGRTSYAIQYGKDLAVSSHVLYLNLELYGGIGGIFPQEGSTLADALYYSRQEGRNLGWTLASLVSHMGELDYLLPVRVSEDLKKVPAEDVRRLIEQIAEAGMYDVVILDIDEGIRDCYELLRMCGQILVPVLADESAEAKLLQMEQELHLLGYEDVRRRMKKVEVIR